MVIDEQCPGPGQGGYPSDCELTEALRNRARERSAPVVRSKAWQELYPRAKMIKLLLLDVDGVLTDGTLTYSDGKVESTTFHTQDGLGLRLLQDSGVAVGLITARSSEAVARRAADLRFAHLYQGVSDKLATYETLLQETGLRPPQTAYMGDDWIDLPLLNRVGLAAAPANGVAEVRQRVHFVSSRVGGSGAVRELCELLLEAQSSYGAMFARYDR